MNDQNDLPRRRDILLFASASAWTIATPPAQSRATMGAPFSGADHEPSISNTEGPVSFQERRCGIAEASILPSKFGGIWNGESANDAQFSSALVELQSLPYPGGEIQFQTRKAKMIESYNITNDILLNFGSTWIYLIPEKKFSFSYGWSEFGASSQISRPFIKGGNIRLVGPKSTSFRFQNCDSPIIRDTNIDLIDTEQVAIHIKANQDPPAPYYGLIDGIRIYGGSNPSPGDGRTGIIFEGLPIAGSFGVNRWLLSNIRLIGFIDYGLEIQGADGLVGNCINLEGCYRKAIRFGHGNRQAIGKITSLLGNGTGGFRSTDLVGIDFDRGGTLVVNTGLNSGYSLPVHDFLSEDGSVYLPYALPFLFSPGDQFTLTEAKARNISLGNVTYEGSGQNEDYVHFTPGSRNCRVRTNFLTIEGGLAMRRDIEDPDCGIASEYRYFEFEGIVPRGTGSIWLDQARAPDVKSSSRTEGGGAWVDCVSVTASIRTTDSDDGVIDVHCVANGIDQKLSPKLTRISPSYAIRCRKTLAPTDFLNIASTVQIMCTYNNLARDEHIRVLVRLGRIG